MPPLARHSGPVRDLPAARIYRSCHVICAVWSQTRGRWLWIDPTFDAYVTDEPGTPLGIRGVHERMCNGKPYLLNPEAAQYGYATCNDAWFRAAPDLRQDATD